MKIIHIIEYEKRGTLWQLLSPLSCYQEHEIFESKNKFFRLDNKDNIYIIHSSGRKFPMVSNLLTFLEDGVKIACFIHTAPDYIILKGYSDFLEQIRYLQRTYNLLLMVPSREMQNLYNRYLIETKVVELGVKSIDQIKNYDDLLGHLKKRIITIATNSKEVYLHAKGIDIFCELMNRMSLTEKALILGVDTGRIRGIECVKLDKEKMQYVLYNSLMYVQLSRSESYNITSIEAKQMMIPQVLSKVGGHINVLNEGALVEDVIEAEERIRLILENGTDKEQLFYVSERSKKYENIEQFCERINTVLDDKFGVRS